jgi:parallel beta-helix repeat protein
MGKDMRKYFLIKALTIGIIFSFIITIIVPNAQSFFLKWEPKLSNDLNYQEFPIHPGKSSGIYTNFLNWLSFNNKYFRIGITKMDFSVKSACYKFINQPPKSTSDGITLYVGGSGPNNYTSIQSAVKDANAGDTVYVFDDSSPYYFSNTMVIRDSIKLIGENKETTIIDQNKESSVMKSSIIDIYADEVTISGFTIRNSGDFYYDYGIEIITDNNNISGNIIENNYIGIVITGYDTYGHYNIISNNIIKSNYNGGILLYNSINNVISNNTFSDNIGGLILDNAANNNNIIKNVFYNDGIWVANAYENIFSNNVVNNKPIIYLEDESDIIINNSDTGQVILVSCSNITVKDNELSNICSGILLSNTDNCLVMENTIVSNSRVGIYLLNSNGNNISKNTLSENYMGIVINSSYTNIITGNNITNCKLESVYLFESYNNYIFENNFLNNKGLTLEFSYNNNISNNIFKNDGLAIYGYYQNTVLNNIVNGKPLLFLVGEENKVLNDAGQIILVGCNNITIQEQEIFNTPIGITIIDTSYTNILNNLLNNNSDYGILMVFSYKNNISLNEVSNSLYTGIGLFNSSTYNTVIWNTISFCNYYGIMIVDSNNNIISTNTISHNGGNKKVENGLGLFLYYSSSNKVVYNNFIFNTRNAFFDNSRSTSWFGNYWNRPKILPKIILGKSDKVIPLPIINLLNLRINFDLNPAIIPNIIP